MSRAAPSLVGREAVPPADSYDRDEFVREIAEFFSVRDYRLIHACAGPSPSPPTLGTR